MRPAVMILVPAIFWTLALGCGDAGEGPSGVGDTDGSVDDDQDDDDDCDPSAPDALGGSFSATVIEEEGDTYEFAGGAAFAVMEFDRLGGGSGEDFAVQMLGGECGDRTEIVARVFDSERPEPGTYTTPEESIGDQVRVDLYSQAIRAVSYAIGSGNAIIEISESSDANVVGTFELEVPNGDRAEGEFSAAVAETLDFEHH